MAVSSFNDAIDLLCLQTSLKQLVILVHEQKLLRRKIYFNVIFFKINRKKKHVAEGKDNFMKTVNS